LYNILDSALARTAPVEDGTGEDITGEEDRDMAVHG